MFSVISLLICTQRLRKLLCEDIYWTFTVSYHPVENLEDCCRISQTSWARSKLRRKVYPPTIQIWNTSASLRCNTLTSLGRNSNLVSTWRETLLNSLTHCIVATGFLIDVCTFLLTQSKLLTVIRFRWYQKLRTHKQAHWSGLKNCYTLLRIIYVSNNQSIFFQNKPNSSAFRFVIYIFFYIFIYKVENVYLLFVIGNFT